MHGDRMGWNVIFDKVRYPGYKELVYRKKDQKYLATDLSVVKTLVGLGGPAEMGGK